MSSSPQEPEDGIQAILRPPEARRHSHHRPQELRLHPQARQGPQQEHLLQQQRLQGCHPDDLRGGQGQADRAELPEGRGGCRRGRVHPLCPAIQAGGVLRSSQGEQSGTYGILSCIFGDVSLLIISASLTAEIGRNVYITSYCDRL